MQRQPRENYVGIEYDPHARARRDVPWSRCTMHAGLATRHGSYGTHCIAHEGRVPTMKFNRITVDPKVCTGKPCIRGLRFPVSRLLGLLAAGETKASILEAYPYLEAEDIAEALRYAAVLAEDETVELAK